MKIKNTELNIIKGSLVEVQVEAVVNPTNNQLVMKDGLALLLKEKGGAYIEKDAANKGPIGFGDVISTNAGALQAKTIIHAAVFGMDGSTDENKIRKSCRNVLQCADQLKIKTLCFPPIGCDAEQFPIAGAAKIMAQEFLKALRGKTTLERIDVCINDEEMKEVFEKNIFGYIEHIQKDLAQGPYVTVDIIVEMPEGIIVIERSNPPYGWALPGGFLDYGESLEDAARREAKEETHVELENLRQFHTYSKPDRDPRFHTVSTVFVAQGKGVPQFGDDAKGIKVVAARELLNLTYAFDHKEIIKEYLASKKQNSPLKPILKKIFNNTKKEA